MGNQSTCGLVSCPISEVIPSFGAAFLAGASLDRTYHLSHVQGLKALTVPSNAVPSDVEKSSDR